MLWIELKTYIQGDEERCIIWCELLRDFLFFFFPQCSFFCLFHFSSCLVPPPWRSFIEIALEVVCVWPARAVIEPICCLAPVGLNPGLTALRWLNAFAMFLKPILFLFLPSSLNNLPPSLPPLRQPFSLCEYILY